VFERSDISHLRLADLPADGVDLQVGDCEVLVVVNVAVGTVIDSAAGESRDDVGVSIVLPDKDAMAFGCRGAVSMIEWGTSTGTRNASSPRPTPTKEPG